MDIKFYDYNFNLVGILPQNSKINGYNALNFTIDFNDIGNFELEFVSDKIKSLVKTHKNNLFIVAGKFQGYLTGYLFKDTCRLYGKHLNGLLHKAVIPIIAKQTNNVETITRKIIEENYSFLTLGEVKGFDTKIEFETDKYIQGDNFFKDLLQRDNAGYNISIDFSSRKLVFEVLKLEESNLVLSEEKLNAYDFETNYDNKKLAYGGWYKEKQEEGEGIWKYISLEENSGKYGLYKEDVVLTSNNKNEALAELKKKKAIFDIKAKTKKIKWGKDYQLGTILKIRYDNEILTKKVTSINVSYEAEEIETPTLTEV